MFIKLLENVHKVMFWRCQMRSRLWTLENKNLYIWKLLLQNENKLKWEKKVCFCCAWFLSLFLLLTEFQFSLEIELWQFRCWALLIALIWPMSRGRQDCTDLNNVWNFSWCLSCRIFRISQIRRDDTEANSSCSPLEIRGQLSHCVMWTLKKRKGQWHWAFTCTQIIPVLESEPVLLKKNDTNARNVFSQLYFLHQHYFFCMK